MKPGDLVFCDVDDISLYTQDDFKYITWKKKDPGIVIHIKDNNLVKVLTLHGIIEVYFEFMCK